MAGLALAGGCAGEGGTEATTQPEEAPPPVPMTPTSAGAKRICDDLELLPPECPDEVPESRYGLAGRPVGFEGPYDEGGYAVCVVRAAGRCAAEVFHLEGGVPTGEPRRDRPPRFAHVALYAARGELGVAVPFELPCSGPEVGGYQDRLLTQQRKTAACLGDETIAGRRGTLALAPPYPTGGEAGGHLFFLWNEDGISRAATLHAWEPVAETIDVLELVVASAGSAG